MHELCGSEKEKWFLSIYDPDEVYRVWKNDPIDACYEIIISKLHKEKKKKLCDYGYGGAPLILEIIFPELKESEEEQIMEDAVNAVIDFPLVRFPNIYPNYKELREYCIRHGIKDNDKVKITIVKENKL